MNHVMDFMVPEVRSKIISGGGPLVIATNRQAYNEAPLTF